MWCGFLASHLTSCSLKRWTILVVFTGWSFCMCFHTHTHYSIFILCSVVSAWCTMFIPLLILAFCFWFSKVRNLAILVCVGMCWEVLTIIVSVFYPFVLHFTNIFVPWDAPITCTSYFVLNHHCSKHLLSPTHWIIPEIGSLNLFYPSTASLHFFPRTYWLIPYVNHYTSLSLCALYISIPSYKFELWTTGEVSFLVVIIMRLDLILTWIIFVLER